MTACINISKEETLLRPKRNDKPVLLNLPKQILDEVDLAVREQGVRRSYFLRQAIERNLRHYQRVERAVFARIYQEGMS
jgi:metal-responsive CopG/Arc/MetJ family transcriptional regulator